MTGFLSAFKEELYELFLANLKGELSLGEQLLALDAQLDGTIVAVVSDRNASLLVKSECQASSNSDFYSCQQISQGRLSINPWFVP